MHAPLNRRKISILAPDLVTGGMTRAYALAQALSHAGYAVEILGTRLARGTLYPQPPAHIEVTDMTGRNRLHSLLRLLMKIDGDILYAIKPRPSSYGIALLKRWTSGTPVVLDIDDWEIAELRAAGNKQAAAPAHRPKGGPPGCLAQRARRVLRSCRRWLNPADSRYVRWLDKAICKADAVTVNTRFLQARYGGTYVPQCKDADRYNPDRYDPEASRRRYGLSAYTVLMFPGTARPHKGLEDLLLAMDTLQRPDARLVIVGGRRCSDAYIAQLAQRWAHWIVRLPTYPQEQMPDVVAAAHVVVVPQRDTGIARAQFPMKLTDAMAMGKPILTTTVGDIPEIVGACGYLVAPSNPAQLAAMLDEILNDPHLACARGVQARARFVSDYSLNAVSPVLSGIMESLG